MCPASSPEPVGSLVDRTLAQMRAGLDAGDFTSEDLTRAHLERIAAVNPALNAYLHVDREGALASARSSDAARRAKGAAPPPPLSGLPLALKDILCVAGMPTTCGSRLLEGYRPPYDATVVERLRGAGAVILGKTNMDEFAMGSSCENSGYGPCRNPLDPGRVPGGSSGGTAAAVAARAAGGGYGTDTGGSIRQPAALCGLVGLKPTYGRVSRRGLVAFASSLDQVGPMARTVDDAALLLEAIWGPDPLDATTHPEPPEPLGREGGLAGLRLGVVRDWLEAGVDAGVGAALDACLGRIAEAGGELVDVRLPRGEEALATYYVLATAEASANLARFDGVRYGQRRLQEGDDLNALYTRTRGAGFGKEVQRRILLGTYALSAGYYDAYYLRAQKVRTLIRRDFAAALDVADVLLGPTSPEVAFPLGEKTRDPLTLYRTDIFTVPVSLAGLPALSLPCGESGGLPVGLQVIGGPFQEARVLQVARGIEAALQLAPFAPAPVG